MAASVKLALLAAGVFLLAGLLGGVAKYHGIMTRPSRRAHPYIDIAHRSALLYSFAALLMAELLRYSPYSPSLQLWMTAVPLFFFALAIGRYFQLGFQGRETNQFKQRNFITTWGMLLLIVGEIGGVAAIVWGFVSTQILV